MKELDKDFWNFRSVFSVAKLLNLVETPERYRFFANQMEELFWRNMENDMTPLDGAGIKDCATCINPRNAIYLKALVENKKGVMKLPNELGCAEEHYRLIKTAYLEEHDSVLIFEDDVRFIKDKDTIRRTLETIPDGWDVLMFGAFTCNPNIKLVLQQHQENGYWARMPIGMNLWNCSMYALSRKGMEIYLMMQDSSFRVADSPLNHIPELNHKYGWGLKPYITLRPVVIQEDKDVFVSSIRGGEFNDGIDYKTQNSYEWGINRDDYFKQEDFKEPK